MKRFLLSSLCVLAALAPTLATADDAAANQKLVEETIAKARAYLGAEAKLQAVQTLRYSGVIVFGSGDSGTVDIVFKKPSSQQINSVVNGMKEVSTLKRTEAWQKVERHDEPGSWTLNLYEVDDILRMQANVRDQFDFMAPPSTRTGKVIFEGEHEIDGVKTRALRYDHGNGRFFLHFVDPATGQVLRSVNDLGMIFMKTGEIVVDGIRFPEKLITRFRTPLGVETLEVSYSKITVNEKIDDAIFDMPLLAE